MTWASDIIYQPLMRHTVLFAPRVNAQMACRMPDLGYPLTMANWWCTLARYSHCCWSVSSPSFNIYYTWEGLLIASTSSLWVTMYHIYRGWPTNCIQQNGRFGISSQHSIQGMYCKERQPLLLDCFKHLFEILDWGRWDGLLTACISPLWVTSYHICRRVNAQMAQGMPDSWFLFQHDRLIGCVVQQGTAIATEVVHAIPLMYKTDGMSFW